MNKLFAIVAASAFALTSVSTFAANDVKQVKPATSHSVVHKASNAQTPTFHQVKHGRKHAKRHGRKARRAV